MSASPVAAADAQPGVRYRLRAHPPRPPVVLSGEQRAVVDSRHRRLRVLAGPGTGKTSTLVETVAARVEAGAAPEELLVLTFSRRARAELVARIAGRIGVTTRVPWVRTLHSYAFALISAEASRSGEPPPRLLPAGEADVMVRELLAGHEEAGGGPWPAYLRQALTSATFAEELTDLLSRTTNQGIDPSRMAALGRRFKIPEWSSAADFAREYQQVSDLRQGTSGFGAALDHSELTAAALAALGNEATLAAEQQRVRRIFVDEYQDVDPAQATLIERLATAADELVVFGDPDQSIYAFRGSQPAVLQRIDVDATVILTRSARLAPAVLDATRRLARLLPGPGPHREMSSGVPGAAGSGSVEVVVFASQAAQAAHVADRFRRYHLLDGVPWSQMAVLVRSASGSAPAVTRAFLTAEVPVVRDGAEVAPAADPVVTTLTTVLRYGLDPAVLTGETALDLLGPGYGGLDPTGLRRLRRALRAAGFGQGSSADLAAALLAGAPLRAAVPADLLGAVDRVVVLLDRARQVVRTGDATAEQMLWEVWHASGLVERLRTAAERGGRSGQRAGRSLDAVMALFELAADLAERLPMAGLRAFLDAVAQRQIGPGRTPAGSGPVGVSLLSAHAAKGLEFDVVAVVDVQEGRWPDLRRRGRLLHGAELLDSAAGLPAREDSISAELAEERRLFYVATTRARHHLIAAGISDADQVPSRFLAELAGSDGELPVVPATARRAGTRRGLVLSELIADLRRAVIDPTAEPTATRAAVRQLARLAQAGVPGAHPRDWHGLAETSTADPPVAAGATVTVSPSTVESLTDCALRTVLERAGGRVTDPSQAQVEGVVVHALAHGLAQGGTVSFLRGEVDRFLDGQQLPPWQLARARRVIGAMLDSALDWRASTHPPRRLVGSEVEVTAVLPGTEPGDHPVRVAGRIDWLSELPDGALLVTDFKTGASVPTREKAAGHAQLATYQVALAHGGPAAAAPTPATLSAAAGQLTDGPEPGPPSVDARRENRVGGAELVFLRFPRVRTLPQPALGPEQLGEWSTTIRTAAQQLARPQVWARENARCERCPVRASCPLQADGRQVTR